jgi:hypothetical protein
MGRRNPEYVKLRAHARYRRWRCRCSHCESRITLRKHPDAYQNKQPCARCFRRLLQISREVRAAKGSALKRLKFERQLIQKRRYWRVDWNRQLRRDKGRATLCDCGAWEWSQKGGPHRAGSCAHGKGRRPDIDRAA